jgi:murein DD-endopeptidase MepM/ murein hydrolase activator NlpD
VGRFWTAGGRIGRVAALLAVIGGTVAWTGVTREADAGPGLRAPTETVAAQDADDDASPLARDGADGGRVPASSPQTPPGKPHESAERDRTSAVTAPARPRHPPRNRCTNGQLSSEPQVACSSLTPFTLRSVDACFFRGVDMEEGWPVPPYPMSVEELSAGRRRKILALPSAVRGSFNEPRGPVHFGVDVETADRGPVYAMRSGVVWSIEDRGVVHVGDAGAYLSYWHVSPLPSLAVGRYVQRGQLIGRVHGSSRHVHVSEWYEPCGGMVDPRRPAGPLHDPEDEAAPRIGRLTAYVADGSAFVHIDPDAAIAPDPGRRMSRRALSGLVDLRADVSILPQHRTGTFAQLPLAPAAIRTYLAPLGNHRVALGTVYTYNGVRLVEAGAVDRLWAHGTHRRNDCFYRLDDPTSSCGVRMSYHVGGPSGYDTRAVPDGRYQFCIEALSHTDVLSRRCTPVAIEN